MEPLQNKALSSKDDEPRNRALLSKDNEPLQNQALSSKDDEQVLTLDNTTKIFKIVPHKKPKAILTPELKLERKRKSCLNFLNKVNGAAPEKPTMEEIKKWNRQNSDNFRELHKTVYNAYMNNLMKEKYKNDEAYRLREKERGRLRVLKRRAAKLLKIDETIFLNFPLELEPFYFNNLTVTNNLNIHIFYNVSYALFKNISWGYVVF
jgi:hypothetical protein